MIASLPMYDWPEVREFTDSWWAGIARHLGSEVELLRGYDYTAAWRDPALLFSQTCGYPFTHEYRGRLKLVGTPHYGADGCKRENYCSMVFARSNAPLEHFRGSVAAVNTADSMSGMLALKLVFGPLARGGNFFRGAFETGGHIASLKAVREDRAQVCAVDAVCVAMARRYRPDYLKGLTEIARSPQVPALPYVTAAGDVQHLRRALDQVFTDKTLAVARERLFLTGYTATEPNVYDVITDLESAMQRAGGLKLL